MSLSRPLSEHHPAWTPADLAQLGRLRVSLMAAGSTLFGYLLATPEVPLYGVPAMLGSFLLCAGCSALNQLQEQNLDSRMHRTRQRPLPSGRMGRSSAHLAGLASLALSLALYGVYGQPFLLVLHLFVLVTYNLAYTPLKRITPMALLLGAIPGSLPPMVGWCAAGGHPGHPLILAVTGLFYLWQVPHFWLLVNRYRDDFSRAGLPVPPLFARGRRLAWLLPLWLAAMTTLALAFPALALMDNPLLMWALVAMAAALVYGSAKQFGKTRPPSQVVDLFMLAFMAMLLIDAWH